MKRFNPMIFGMFLALVALVGVQMQSVHAATGDVGVSIKPNSIKFSQLEAKVLKSVDVNLTSTQMDALNATPITVISAPGSGYVTQVESVLCFNDFVTTAFELGSGTVDFDYTNSSGGIAAQLTNAFVESSADAYFQAYGRDAVAQANAAIVAYATTDVSTGSGSLNCRLFYRTVLASDI